MFTDNPLNDFLRHDADQNEALEDSPRCSDCGEPIYDEYYDICGDYICEDCIRNYKRRVG